MDNKEFWRLVETAALETRGICRPMAERLTELLALLDPQEIEDFQREFDAMSSQAYTWELWAAAYIINGGCSDDCFDYFRGWLIAQGHEVFERAVRNPGNLSRHKIDRNDPQVECEDILYAAQKAYQQVTGHDLPARHSVGTAGGPSGEPWEEDELEERFPNLWARFNG